MENDLISKFTDNELLSFYVKMLVYKFDIKDENKIIGLGLYFDVKPGIEVNMLIKPCNKPLILI